MNNKLHITNSYEDCVIIRTKVFIEEQGVNPDMEFDEIDDYASHIALYKGEELIGSGRVFEIEENVYRLGRVAILKQYRNIGYGKFLLGELEKVAISLGARHIIILGQISAIGFYHKQGYKEIGDINTEDGLPEIFMRKTIKVD